jgi:hypothetical protein
MYLSLVKQRFTAPVVFTFMTAMPISSASGGGRRSVAIERPRASDAIGAALRNAFDRDARLPADMARLLKCLDKAPPRRPCR